MSEMKKYKLIYKSRNNSYFRELLKRTHEILFVATSDTHGNLEQRAREMNEHIAKFHPERRGRDKYYVTDLTLQEIYNEVKIKE